MKKFKDIVLINGLALVVGFSIYCLTNYKIEILGAIVATGISISIGVRQYKTENDKIFKELFLDFNHRYNNRFNDALEEIVEQYKKDKTNALSEESRKLLIDYFNLCAEEFFWNEKGRISKKVWDAWEKGMIYYLSNPLIRKILIDEYDQRESYYGFYEFMVKHLHQ